MTNSVVIRPAAERDINHAVDWYLEHAPEQAERFAEDLGATIRNVQKSPRLFRAVYGEVRRAALKKFPYLIWLVFFDEAKVVHVLALSHQRQDPGSVLRLLS